MSGKYKYSNHCSLNQRGMFLPIMLCARSSIKDVKLSHQRSPSLSNDPISPRVSCAGQITKRNNKVIGSPTPHKLNFTPSAINNAVAGNTNSSNINILKYHKLKKFFSGKSVTNSPTTTISAGAYTSRATTDRHINSCRGRRTVLEGAIANRSEFDCGNSCGSNLINLEDLDPPLPVIRKVRLPGNDAGGEKDSLWKRRSGGVALQSLQVKSIQSYQSSLQAISV
ncbi:hypothetical protein Ancab_038242 [Ancistrocladus abbreviatus]